MLRKTDFYINGKWIAPAVAKELEVINPADEQAFAVISLGSAADVDKAVSAARKAFISWSITSREERLAWLERLLAVYETRIADMATAISSEMGAPIKMALDEQAASGTAHIKAFIRTLKNFKFERPLDERNKTTRIAYEPIGVCGLITPWNWPMNQVVLKVVPAIAAGCTVILKPSEIAPISSVIFAEMVDASGLPAGVFNLVNGDGPSVGEAMSRHPGIDMMSFTGSTRAGVAVTKAAAETVKRVSLELGGKSPNIVFADADLEAAITRGVSHVFNNTGQSCNAPTRMLVERSVYDKATEIAAAAAKATKVGDPSQDGDHMGPLVSEMQFNKVQGLIEQGIKEGARLIAGGAGRPEGFNRGYYVRPTVFADVNNDMTIAREEIFGPVLAMIPFDTEEEAVEIANDTPYGLAAYIQSGDSERIRRVSKQLRAGMVRINGASHAADAPFGGYKQSGIGREGGHWGLEDFLEVKAISGWEDSAA
ncbi:aldehyde dehydrogenase family protein [Phyllobacterium brassicacearum]|uniref:Aldehyde dehydrogenase n=1 Tax=Phyllobacterium brassicacearum TaxID=314235 RepID=A0A2P7BS57_9HYPH|nr:aldehyde dehydrogenase family protein [Phyllobacterium brassicacearum]PSH69299.1 aldehyde dehydrogenase family protein [Phyllobacterium brassicacearum]TDQ34534.1 aldehyde dehydrogenase (NAD+) [Phyllobacterium brassicacearum]